MIPFTHDPFARMTSDGRKGLLISYNILNLPEKVVKTDSTDMATFRYLYDGTKVAAVRSNVTSIRYQGSFVIDCSATGFPSTIKSIAWADGVCAAKDGGSGYGDYLNVKDHLGNVRDIVALYKADTTPISNVIAQKSDYLPFGQRISDMTSPYASSPFSATTATHRWHLGTKEEVPKGGLNLLDFGARYYDPALCRWTSMDPMAEKYYGVSPFTYCKNNPILYTDSNGLFIEEDSKEEWDHHRHFIDKKLDKVMKRLEKLKAKNKEGQRFARLEERKNGLEGINAALDALESSTQGYSLKYTTGDSGYVKYNPDTGLVDIYTIGSSTSSFVHETTHAMQFETRDIGFIKKTGATIAQDIFDEIDAYKAQYVFEGNNPSSITPEWLLNIIGSNGLPMYSPKGECNTAREKINSNTLLYDALKAYDNRTIIVIPNVHLYEMPDYFFKP